MGLFPSLGYGQDGLDLGLGIDRSHRIACVIRIRGVDAHLLALAIGDEDDS
jgi:hypothetical protein